MHLRIAAIGLLFLAACGTQPAMTGIAQSDAPLLLLGEQHDAPAHHELQRQLVQELARRGTLAALALEMAEQGASTAGLSAQAGEEEVQRALNWNPEAWPWSPYAPAVMAAVAAGVPVIGANLPRERMAAAMNDAAFDALLPAPALKAQQQAIRVGHCELLPEAQIGPMARIQIARDQAMARTIAQLLQAGKTVVLIAGAGHVDPELGVPRHLPRGLEAKAVLLPADPEPRKDYCEEMRRSMAPKP